MRPLSVRDLETLNELGAATINHGKFGFLDGWARPMDCGGTDGSHHGATLRKLHRRGLCDRKSWRSHRRTSLYKINATGLKALAEFHHQLRKTAR